MGIVDVQGRAELVTSLYYAHRRQIHNYSQIQKGKSQDLETTIGEGDTRSYTIWLMPQKAGPLSYRRKHKEEIQLKVYGW